MPKPKGQNHTRNAMTELEAKAFKGPGRLNDGGGLSLVVTAAGYRRWILRFTFGGKQRDLLLGSTSKITLKQARSAREKAHGYLSEGINPNGVMSARARKSQEVIAAGIPNFGNFSEQYVNELAPSLKNKKSRQPWDLTINTYCKSIKNFPINIITVDDVAGVLRPIWTAKFETAKKVRWRIEAIFAAAIVKGYREKDQRGEIIQRENPAKLEYISQLPGFKKPKGGNHTKHLPAMAYQDTPAFVSQLRQAEGFSARALELTIFTACRTGDAIGAVWSEIDFDKAIWTIPAIRMKMAREHMIPLVPHVVELLSCLDRTEASQFLFPGTLSKKHLSNMAMLKRLERMGHGDVTTHGFRTAFRTWASECTEHPREIAEMALAHQIGSDVERAYNRTTLIEKRRQLMGEWTAYCLSGV